MRVPTEVLSLALVLPEPGHAGENSHVTFEQDRGHSVAVATDGIILAKATWCSDSLPAVFVVPRAELLMARAEAAAAGLEEVTIDADSIAIGSRKVGYLAGQTDQRILWRPHFESRSGSIGWSLALGALKKVVAMGTEFNSPWCDVLRTTDEGSAFQAIFRTPRAELHCLALAGFSYSELAAGPPPAAPIDTPN